MQDTPLHLDAASTALVLIDLQKGILGTPCQPHSGADVIGRANALAKRFRALGAPVVLVRVGWSKDGGDKPSLAVDAPSLTANPPADWLDYVDNLDIGAHDIPIIKRHWGAFTGTELDLQLRRRGIDTIVIGGVATNFGVESTARSGWELGYSVVIAEDASSSRDASHHAFAVETIFPRIARVRRTTEIAAALNRS